MVVRWRLGVDGVGARRVTWERVRALVGGLGEVEGMNGWWRGSEAWPR